MGDPAWWDMPDIGND